MPKSIRVLGFWNQLFFWVTIIASVKLWLEHRERVYKEHTRITINGKEYLVKHVVIKDGYIFLDGKYIGPGDIDSIVVHED